MASPAQMIRGREAKGQRRERQADQGARQVETLAQPPAGPMKNEEFKLKLDLLAQEFMQTNTGLLACLLETAKGNMAQARRLIEGVLELTEAPPSPPTRPSAPERQNAKNNSCSRPFSSSSSSSSASSSLAFPPTAAPAPTAGGLRGREGSWARVAGVHTQHAPSNQTNAVAAANSMGEKPQQQRLGNNHLEDSFSTQVNNSTRLPAYPAPEFFNSSCSSSSSSSSSPIPFRLRRYRKRPADNSPESDAASTRLSLLLSDEISSFVCTCPEAANSPPPSSCSCLTSSLSPGSSPCRKCHAPPSASSSASSRQPLRADVALNSPSPNSPKRNCSFCGGLRLPAPHLSELNPTPSFGSPVDYSNYNSSPEISALVEDWAGRVVAYVAVAETIRDAKAALKTKLLEFCGEVVALTTLPNAGTSGATRGNSNRTGSNNNCLSHRLELLQADKLILVRAVKKQQQKLQNLERFAEEQAKALEESRQETLAKGNQLKQLQDVVAAYVAQLKQQRARGPHEDDEGGGGGAADFRISSFERRFPDIC
eukprot:GHVT01023603.1.p1 GENE.GHVT01023603.1~~GHVT01023603.1.p1  ORF type:complete len:539 (-),score=137.82 GHVT01023603.1:651-2267(-)